MLFFPRPNLSLPGLCGCQEVSAPHSVSFFNLVLIAGDLLPTPANGPESHCPKHPRKQQSTPLPFLPKPNADPNLVEWEGPDDPENPQNWPFWYKWWLLVIPSSSLTHCLLARSPLQRLHPQGQARANDMTTLLVTRCLCGFFAVAPLTNSTGVIADLWDPVNRGITTSLFASSVFLGPVLGPVIGSL